MLTLVVLFIEMLNKQLGVNENALLSLPTIISCSDHFRSRYELNSLIEIANESAVSELVWIGGGDVEYKRKPLVAAFSHHRTTICIQIDLLCHIVSDFPSPVYEVQEIRSSNICYTYY
jgi:hypothetical protein